MANALEVGSNYIKIKTSAERGFAICWGSCHITASGGAGYYDCNTPFPITFYDTPLCFGTNMHSVNVTFDVTLPFITANTVRIYKVYSTAPSAGDLYFSYIAVGRI